MAKEILILTLDTETEGLGGKIKRIAVYDTDEVYYGYTFNDLIPLYESLSKGYELHTYIHNMDFDLRKMMELWEENGKYINWKSSLIINRKMVKIVHRKYGTFHDSFAILPFSLKKISKDFDLAHGKIDLWDAVKEKYGGVDYGPNDERRGEYQDILDYFIRCDRDDDIYIRYLGYDVLSLHEALDKLITISRLPVEDFVKCVSTSSLSRRIYKNGWGNIKFEDEEGTSDYDRLTLCKGWGSDKVIRDTSITWAELESKLRQSYCGGRTEVFTPRCDNTAYYYDINSMYPSVMLYDMPIGWPEYTDAPRLVKNKWVQWLRHHKGLGFLECDIYIPPQYIPPLPVKKGKTFFPTGHVRGIWTYPELEYAIEKCGCEIENYISITHFKKTYPVYKRFIETLYPLKAQAKRDKNAVLKTFVKLLINTGYGWSGMKRLVTAYKPIKEKEKWEEKGYIVTKVSQEYGFIEIVDKMYAHTIQVQIASYVTSYARLKLLDMLRYSANLGTVYYCDTDSIVTDVEFPAEICDPEELGLWDIENVLERGVFLQPKLYCFTNRQQEDISKAKGVKRRPSSDFYYKLYRKLVDGCTDRIEVEHNIVRLSSLITAMGNEEDLNKLTVLDKNINLGNTQKREMNYQCNSSRPIHFPTVTEFLRFNFMLPQGGRTKEGERVAQIEKECRSGNLKYTE